MVQVWPLEVQARPGWAGEEPSGGNLPQAGTALVLVLGLVALASLISRRR